MSTITKRKEPPGMELENNENAVPALLVSKKARPASPPRQSREARVLQDKTNSVLQAALAASTGPATPPAAGRRKPRSFSDTAVKTAATAALGGRQPFGLSPVREHDVDPFAPIPSASRSPAAGARPASVAQLLARRPRHDAAVAELEAAVARLERELASRDKVIGTLTVDLSETQRGYLALERRVLAAEEDSQRLLAVLAEKDAELRDCYEVIEHLDRARDDAAEAGQRTPERLVRDASDEESPPATPHHVHTSGILDEAPQIDESDAESLKTLSEPPSAEASPETLHEQLLTEQVRRFRAESTLEAAQERISELERQLDGTGGLVAPAALSPRGSPCPSSSPLRESDSAPLSCFSPILQFEPFPGA